MEQALSSPRSIRTMLMRVRDLLDCLDCLAELKRPRVRREVERELGRRRPRLLGRGASVPAMLMFAIESGEIVESIERQANSAGVQHGAIVSLIGGVDEFTVSTMAADDATTDIVSTYRIPGEMHGAGEIRDGKAHVHATFAIQGDRAVAGHVHSAIIGTWFARAYVIPLAQA
ncbi:PCC domain-containing protein [Nocardia sp. NBC_01388]|uniref:PCC domain-containing protein n=1 Tax=Nocardia sp. NBC_01388 TaxID=2903596 RepID=UPI003244DF5E